MVWGQAPCTCTRSPQTCTCSPWTHTCTHTCSPWTYTCTRTCTHRPRTHTCTRTTLAPAPQPSDPHLHPLPQPSDLPQTCRIPAPTGKHFVLSLQRSTHSDPNGGGHEGVAGPVRPPAPAPLAHAQRAGLHGLPPDAAPVIGPRSQKPFCRVRRDFTSPRAQGLRPRKPKFSDAADRAPHAVFSAQDGARTDTKWAPRQQTRGKRRRVFVTAAGPRLRTGLDHSAWLRVVVRHHRG